MLLATVARALYCVPSIPIHSCILLDTAEEARAFPRRDLELAYCEACGFIFNHIFDEGIMGYSTNFEESQHFSGTFNAFAKELAREAARKCAIAGKHVLEIGCGKGDFLRKFCSARGATGLGIDPGYRVDEGRSRRSDKVQFITDFFSKKYEHLEADGLSSTSVLRQSSCFRLCMSTPASTHANEKTRGGVCKGLDAAQPGSDRRSARRPNELPSKQGNLQILICSSASK